MQRRLVVAILIAVTALVTIVVVPQVRRLYPGFSGPRSQNGFRLIEVYTPRSLTKTPPARPGFSGRMPPNGPGILVESDHWPAAYANTISLGYSTVKEFTGSGVSSTGMKHRFTCEYATDMDGKPLLAVLFPPALPGSYKWMDVTVRDSGGRSATWRVTRLRRAAHDLQPPVKVVPAATVDGMTVEGRAWYNPKDNNITVQIFAADKPMPVGRWQLEIDKIDREWREETPYNGGNHPGGYGTTVFSNGSNGRLAATRILDDNPAPGGDRFVRIHGTLTLYDRHNETVRFDDLSVTRVNDGYRVRLPHPITRTSASGVSITLSECQEDLGTPLEYTGDWSHRDSYTVYWSRRDSGTGSSVVLPNSPLYRRHRQPIEVIVNPDMSAYDMASYVIPSPGPKQYEFVDMKKPLPGKFDLPFGIYQTVRLRRLPVTLTVPVQPVSPDARPVGDPGKPRTKKSTGKPADKAASGKAE